MLPLFVVILVYMYSSCDKQTILTMARKHMVAKEQCML